MAMGGRAERRVRRLLAHVLPNPRTGGPTPAPNGVRASFSQQNPQGRAFRPTVSGSRGMVTAAHPLAAQAGQQVLAAGGNAVDAGVAVAAALNVVE